MEFGVVLRKRGLQSAADAISEAVSPTPILSAKEKGRTRQS